MNRGFYTVVLLHAAWRVLRARLRYAPHHMRCGRCRSVPNGKSKVVVDGWELSLSHFENYVWMLRSTRITETADGFRLSGMEEYVNTQLGHQIVCERSDEQARDENV